jgi:hypothetical protein
MGECADATATRADMEKLLVEEFAMKHDREKWLTVEAAMVARLI